MFPLLGAFGAAAGGIAGAIGADQTAETNWAINLLNYYQRERERRDAIEQARQNKHDAYLGTTDARGNSTKFVPGQGWVTKLSGNSQAMQDAQDYEQMQELQHDLPAKRARMDSNLSRQREEDYVANGLLDEFKRVMPGDTESTRRKLINSMIPGINDAYNGTIEDASRAALRGGASNSNSAKLLSDLNKQKSDALTSAFLKAQGSADTMADTEYNSKRSGIANLYNLFATRSSAMPNVSFAPQNLTGAADANGSGNPARGDATGSSLMNAFAKQGGTLDYIQPNNGWANAIAGGATAFSQAGQQVQAQQENNSQNALLQQFLAQRSFGGVPTSLGNTGAW